jgi:hypothetical protein
VGALAARILAPEPKLVEQLSRKTVPKLAKSILYEQKCQSFTDLTF